jgi:hypothetical protein
MSNHEEPSTETLMESLVQCLFGVFGAPDDVSTGKQADDLLQALHERLGAANG